MPRAAAAPAVMAAGREAHAPDAPGQRRKRAAAVAARTAMTYIAQVDLQAAEMWPAKKPRGPSGPRAASRCAAASGEAVGGACEGGFKSCQAVWCTRTTPRRPARVQAVLLGRERPLLLRFTDAEGEERGEDGEIFAAPAEVEAAAEADGPAGSINAHEAVAADADCGRSVMWFLGRRACGDWLPTLVQVVRRAPRSKGKSGRWLVRERGAGDDATFEVDSTDLRRICRTDLTCLSELLSTVTRAQWDDQAARNAAGASHSGTTT
mmetsp:Transcript_15888/g.45261  ORF Transcript_15888/g.45261 Transcript_15888/m.45261 type:complete len:265 (+) Transcript_15888:56-850(+)